MALLKEDGSLDIERINNLSFDDFIEEISNFTDEQDEEYWSEVPVCESRAPVKPVILDYSMEEFVKRHGLINADDFINDIKKKYGVK